MEALPSILGECMALATLTALSTRLPSMTRTPEVLLQHVLVTPRY
jgi:hypothetical protein